MGHGGASKPEQKLLKVPAAVFVIAQEDIRRSGMIDLPDLLRMVPGIQVGQAQGGEWAVSSRGFNDSYSNNLLVLVDGRTVYSPISSAVFWDEQDLLPQTAIHGHSSAAATPNQIERVTFRTAGGVGNPYHGDSAISRIADQLLLAPAVDSLKTEIRRVHRHGPVCAPPGARRAAGMANSQSKCGRCQNETQSLIRDEGIVRLPSRHVHRTYPSGLKVHRAGEMKRVGSACPLSCRTAGNIIPAAGLIVHP